MRFQQLLVCPRCGDKMEQLPQLLRILMQELLDERDAQRSQAERG